MFDKFLLSLLSTDDPDQAYNKQKLRRHLTHITLYFASHNITSLFLDKTNFFVTTYIELPSGKPFATISTYQGTSNNFPGNMLLRPSQSPPNPQLTLLQFCPLLTHHNALFLPIPDQCGVSANPTAHIYRISKLDTIRNNDLLNSFESCSVNTKGICMDTGPFLTGQQG